MGSKVFDVSVRPTENGIKVSWVDKIRGYNFDTLMKIVWGAQAFLYIGAFILALYGGDDFLSAALFSLLIGMIPLLIIFLLARVTWRIENSVIFDAKATIVKKTEYATDRISRFEYGARSQLTGQQPSRRKDGSSYDDPHLIRMWIDDMDAVTISTNDLPPENNHKIRNTLEDTLKEIKAKAGPPPSKPRVAKEKPRQQPADRPRGMPDY